MKRIIILLSFMQIVNSVSAKHKTIVSISAPCSLSVAFLRMMRQRGDFVVVHEPGLLAWRMHKHPEKVDHDTYRHEASLFSEVSEQMKKLIEDHNVFIKEEFYAAAHYLHELYDYSKVSVIFLLRNPHHILLSLYNKVKGKIPSAIVDYDAMLQLFELCEQKNKRRPFIIYTEDLTENPSKIIEQFCTYADIPFKEESLHWEDLSSNFINSEIWYDSVHARFDKTWHGNAWKSTGFIEHNKEYAIDKNSNPTFEEIEDAELRAEYLKLYHAMRPAYQRFMNMYHAQQKDLS